MNGTGRRKFIRAHVHGSAEDSGIAVQIRAGLDIRIIACVDARRLGLQVIIAMDRVHEKRDICNITCAGAKGGSTGIDHRAAVPVVCHLRSGVGIDDAVGDHRGVRNSAAGIKEIGSGDRVAGDGAVVKLVSV